MEFQERLQNIDAHYSSEQKVSIHYKSLRNFATHFDGIKKEKNKIRELLSNYFLTLDKEGPDFDATRSREIYAQIEHLGNRYYSRHAGFTADLTLDLVIIICAIPNVLIWFLFKSVSVEYIAIFITLCMASTFYYKKSQGKIYGYRY